MTGPKAQSTGTRPRPVVPDATLQAAASVLARQAGLRFDRDGRSRLARCLLDEAKIRSIDVSRYVVRLGVEPDLLQALLDRITVQETAFFRDPNQFAALRDGVLPQITEPVTIWSAGCSNGQEPYSLAIALTGSGQTLGRVIASDISISALERTRRARYSEGELGAVTASMRERHFVAVGAEWEVAASLRQRVSVVHHNLVTSPPPFEPGQCEVVFCRNVLIYLEEEQALTFLVRLAQWVRPGGWLFLGYSESLRHLSDLFQLEQVGDAFVYRRNSRSAPGTVSRSGGRSGPAPRSGGRSGPAPRSGGRPGPVRARVTTPADRPRAVPDRSEVDEAGTATAGQPGTSPAGTSEILDLLASGEAAVNAGDYPAAVTAFRKCIYLDPDHFLAHFDLGLALEASGDQAAARRAYGSARAALDRSDSAAAEEALEGYNVEELVQLLEAKLHGHPRR